MKISLGIMGKSLLLSIAVFTALVTVGACALVQTTEAEFGTTSEPARRIGESGSTPESSEATATANGTAIVEVVTEPLLCNEGRVRFDGVPAGTITLGGCEPGEAAPLRRISAPNLAVGQQVTVLQSIDSSITDLGYRLSSVQCNDRESGTPSIGDVDARKATFGIDNNESVTCRFILSVGSACVCPKEGRWRVNNHLGKMACSGTFAMTLPLKPVVTNGTIETRDDCATLIAEGMSGDEATIRFRRDPDCGYRGSVGGEEGGIPMTINFSVSVENDERLTGGLKSSVTTKGTTCNMSRTYELDFVGEP